MKVSIVLPVLNGEVNLRNCLDALLGIDYPADSFEVIVINDGSTDATGKIFQEYRSKFEEKGISYAIITNEENKGRIISRESGARKARNKLLLFVDNRAVVDSDILRKYEERKYEPLIGNLYQDPDRNLVSRFFWVLRRFVYRPYFGKEYPDVFIGEDNFDALSKGFCPFFCNKERLLKNLPKKKDRFVNDDTAIFQNIVKEKKILKVSDCRAEYIERSSLKEMVGHIFERGPRFVDFYLVGGSKFSLIIYGIALAPLLALLIGVMAILSPEIVAMSVAVMIIAIIVVFCRSIKDVLALLIVGPIISLAFSLGVYKGLALKVEDLLK